MLNYAAYLAYIWQILRFVRRLLAYIWQVFVRKVSKTCPLSAFLEGHVPYISEKLQVKMPNLPYISQISRFSSDELGVCP